jgi:hypothetical protein
MIHGMISKKTMVCMHLNRTVKGEIRHAEKHVC